MAYAYNPPPQARTGNISLPAPVDSSFTVPYVAQFVIDQKVLTLSSGKFTINDAQGNLLFDVKGKNPLAVHTQRILRDSSGKTVVLMKKQILTMHSRWEVYRGDDDKDSNLLYSVGKSTLSSFTGLPSFEVHLAGRNASRPDFVVQGDYFQHNYSILYNGTPIAEVRKKINVASVFMGKDQYGVTVYPGADHAFIASLIVIMDQVKQADDKAARKAENQGGGHVAYY